MIRKFLNRTLKNIQNLPPSLIRTDIYISAQEIDTFEPLLRLSIISTKKNIKY